MDTQKKQTTKVQPSLMAADLPPAVRVFWDTAPEQFKMASILSAMVCYCTLATRVRVKYVYDLDPHALLIQVLLVGEPSSGKSLTRPIVKQLLKPLKLKDKEQKRIEQAYQDLKKTSAKNKQLPEEPITVCRMLNTITKCKLVKRADMMVRKYSEPLSFFFFSEELATMTESNKRAFADLNTMDRLAYDLGAEYSSDTLSDASYNADVDIIYNSLFCGTENSLSEYMNKRAIEGGNCTRKIVLNIDDDLMGEDAQQFRRQTEKEQLIVNQTIDKLMNETYTEDDMLQPIHDVQMDWLFDDVRSWCQQQREEVLKTGSRALNCYYKRSSVSSFRLSALCFYLWGESEDCKEKVKRFYHFMASFILKGLMAKWGKQYETLHRHDNEDEGPKASLYEQLPQQFSRDQLRELIVKLDLSTPARVFLSKWKRAKLIYDSKTDADIFVKNY